MLLMIRLQDAADKIGWYWYLLLVVVVLVAIIWWMVQQSKKQSQQQAQEPVKEQQEPQVSRLSEAPERERAQDDLTRIEGIGPKVDRVLKDAGIASFDSLAEADPAEVKTVLNKAGLQMMNPEGWIEQARLAADEDWQGLEKLQGELKGGRRK